MTLVYGLIGINGAVFLLWQYALSSAVSRHTYLTKFDSLDESKADFRD